METAIDLKYPIGKFQFNENFEESDLTTAILYLESFPQVLKQKISGYSKEDFERTYREGGWTVRQLIHHLSDSHLNALVRIKFALTEENPEIKPYMENKWAELTDYNLPVTLSLDMLKSIHQKLCYLLDNISEEDIKRTFFHPEHKRKISIEEMVFLYEWHSRHHLKHIEIALEKK